MKKLPLAALGLTLSLIFLVVSVVQAGSSASYTINWQVLNGGGAPASAGVVTLNGSIGQTAVGLASFNTVEVSSGYWFRSLNQAPSATSVYLPFIFKSGQVVIQQ